MKYGAVALLLLVLFFGVAKTTYAITPSVYGSMNDLSVGVYPENPQANQEVTLKIQSFLINLASADISWSLDGKKVQTGVGMIVFKFTTKDIGQSTTIDLTVLPVGSSPITKTITITPSSLDILWEAIDSATPPFYKGKALPTTEANLKFVAMPNIKNNSGALMNKADMIYNWTNNYAVDQNNSGYGKDSYIFQMPITDDHETVGVTALLRGGGLSAEGQVSTKVFDPKIVWYLTSPLYGPQFEHSIDQGFDVTSNDLSVFAEPYYASPKDILASNLSYTWTLNNQTFDAQTPANILSLHRDSMNKGDAIINLVIENSQKYLQELKSSLTLHLQ